MQRTAAKGVVALLLSSWESELRGVTRGRFGAGSDMVMVRRLVVLRKTLQRRTAALSSESQGSDGCRRMFRDHGINSMLIDVDGANNQLGARRVATGLGERAVHHR